MRPAKPDPATEPPRTEESRCQSLMNDSFGKTSCTCTSCSRSARALRRRHALPPTDWPAPGTGTSQAIL